MCDALVGSADTQVFSCGALGRDFTLADGNSDQCCDFTTLILLFPCFDTKLGCGTLPGHAHPRMGQPPALWGWLGPKRRIRERPRAPSGPASPLCQANLSSAESLARNTGSTVLLPAEMLPLSCLLLVCPAAPAKLRDAIRKAEKSQCFILCSLLLSASDLRLWHPRTATKSLVSVGLGSRHRLLCAYLAGRSRGGDFFSI